MRFASISILLLVNPIFAADLTGKVTGVDGLPVSLATVQVSSARPKTAGAEPPADSPDLAKTATTDGEGNFTISGVDETMTFELLMMADGFRPTLVKKVDPARGEIKAKLNAIPQDLDPNLVVKGHVVDSDGKPMQGVHVAATGYQQGTTHYFGNMPDFEKETWTDSKGEFLIICKKDGMMVDILLKGKGVAPMLVPMPQGEQPNEVTMTAGASVSGKLLKDGQPMAGVELRLCQQNRSSATWIGEFNTTSHNDGTFTFEHLKPNERYNVYASMKSMGDRGSVPMTLCQVNEDGTTCDAGEIAVQPGYTLSGQIICSDGKPIPTNARVGLSRADAMDYIDLKLDADGKFEFKGVPNEVCQLSVNANGYHVSSENQSFEGLNRSFLMGVVDDNITDLRVQIDPGPREERGPNAGSNWQTLRGTRMAGVPPP